MSKKRDIGQEILEAIQDIKKGTPGSPSRNLDFVSENEVKRYKILVSGTHGRLQQSLTCNTVITTTAVRFRNNVGSRILSKPKGSTSSPEVC